MLVRQEFVYAMQRWLVARTGRPSDYGKHPLPRWDTTSIGTSYWMRIARLCLDRRISPRRLVSALFQNWSSTRQPMPNMLLSEHVVTAARDNDKAAIKEKQQELQLQFSQLASLVAERVRLHAMSEYDATLAVLRNETLPLSALFRYCVAVRLNDRTIYRHYLRTAALQFRLNDEVFTEAWKDLLTADMRAELQLQLQGGSNG